MEDLLHDENICGRNLLRLASRGSAIIAELLRLSENIPEAFREEGDIADPQQRKYAKVIYDLNYLKDPQEYERRINESDDLIDLDAEVQVVMLLQDYKLNHYLMMNM